MDSPVSPQPAKTAQPASTVISLSTFTKALLEKLSQIKKRPAVDEVSRIAVSRTVSFFAIIYERVRNAVEYREQHLIRRASIERILKRRLLLNPEGRGEAENLLRELLWARYFPDGSLGNADAAIVQSLIDKYVFMRKKLVVGQVAQRKVYYSQFLFDLLTCEIEETLDTEHAKRNSLYTFFIYQVLRKKVRIEEVTKEQKDAFFYVAIERGFAKSDIANLRYHLFTLSHKPLKEMNEAELSEFMTQGPPIFNRIDRVIANPWVEKLTKYVRRQMPSFLILFSLLDRNAQKSQEILTYKDKLWGEVDVICREKYQQTSSRLRNLAIQSLVYIFLTKMVFALILEYPLSIYFYNEVSYVSIAINTIFPPLLMLGIISFVRPPGEENTKRIYERIVNILDSNMAFETTVSYVLTPPKVKKPMLVFGFTLFYSLTFIITLGLIYEVLTALRFNMISQIIFVFFVSVVSFFGYRVSQIAKEYKLQIKDGFFSPFVDIFFMPILSLGKFFSSEIARLNVFLVILDFLIEAPFKLIFEIVEEWISFVRQRKEEII